MHADGAAYRWWTATVESVADHEIVVTWPPGTRFGAPTLAGEKVAEQFGRGYFWLDRPYTIVERYTAGGVADMIASDIASPARVAGRTIVYTDHELDVVKLPGSPPYVEDEDEFLQAVITYGYTPEFQEQCRRTVEDVIRLLDAWIPKGKAISR